MQSNNILWKGKSEVKPDFWGLDNDDGRIRFSFSSGIGLNSSPGKFGTFLWGIAIVFICFTFIPFYSITLAFFVGGSILIFIIYWFFIREFKYFQLAQSTYYQVFKNKIEIHQSFFGKNKKTVLHFNQIKQFHLIKFEVTEGKKKVQKGPSISIWIIR